MILAPLGIDRTLFTAVNGLAGHHASLDAAMVFLAKDAPVLFAVLLAGCWLTWRPAWQRAAALAGLSALMALGIGQLVGLMLPRARPYEVMPAVVLVRHAADTSFPSDHAIMVGAVIASLWFLQRGLTAMLVIIGALVLVARVYIGVHYPTDVIAGAALGAATAVAIMSFARAGAGASGRPNPNGDDCGKGGRGKDDHPGFAGP